MNGRGLGSIVSVLMMAAIAAAGLGGCVSDPTLGYAAGSVFPSGIETIAIPIAENRTFSRDIQFDLTDALIKEVQARTPYRVTDLARADSLLLVQIRDVELDSISRSPLTGLGEEVLVAVTIDFQWTDLAAQADLVARERFTGQRLFVPSAPTGERLELGRFAVVQQLARDVVSELQATW
ncbi:MAG: hypothetical protein HKO59_08555 [Phycisphaerales bacterium]|nr:hypothetical protein [Phycisphaerae bacterium]NNF42450.1 hypothetical protein [Phycisphaerales bacterium]NNM26019.1 hypothetical protein [Phycisphaerales bacterium]